MARRDCNILKCSSSSDDLFLFENSPFLRKKHIYLTIHLYGNITENEYNEPTLYMH